MRNQMIGNTTVWSWLKGGKLPTLHNLEIAASNRQIMEKTLERQAKAAMFMNNMKTVVSSVKIVSASSPEGKRHLADSDQFGEPLWKAKALASLKPNGALKSPPSPPDASISSTKP